MAVGLYACGVDFLYDAAKATWFFIEINASPSFGLHIWPTEGRPEDVVAIYLDAVLENFGVEAGSLGFRHHRFLLVADFLALRFEALETLDKRPDLLAAD